MKWLETMGRKIVLNPNGIQNGGGLLSSRNPIKRRSLLGIGLILTQTANPGQSSAESLLEQAKKVEYGLENGRIRSCPSNLNPNCISTSSTNFDSYASPWKSPGGTIEQIANEIVRLMPIACKGSQLVAASSTEETEYLRFQTDGVFGPDFIEFAVKGDTNVPLVFYRSISGTPLLFLRSLIVFS
eukprot:g384.t1